MHKKVPTIHESWILTDLTNHFNDQQFMTHWRLINAESLEPEITISPNENVHKSNLNTNRRKSHIHAKARKRMIQKQFKKRKTRKKAHSKGTYFTKPRHSELRDTSVVNSSVRLSHASTVETSTKVPQQWKPKRMWQRVFTLKRMSNSAMPYLPSQLLTKRHHRLSKELTAEDILSHTASTRAGMSNDSRFMAEVAYNGTADHRRPNQMEPKEVNPSFNSQCWENTTPKRMVKKYKRKTDFFETYASQRLINKDKGLQALLQTI